MYILTLEAFQSETQDEKLFISFLNLFCDMFFYETRIASRPRLKCKL